MRPSLWTRIPKWIRITGIAVVGLVVVGVLIIRFDTAFAANFADNVLRPVIGNGPTVFLEKIFFNAADKAQSVLYAVKTPESPILEIPGAKAVSVNGGDLNLTPIAPNSAFAPVADEGTWLDHPLAQFPGQEVAAYTFIRPDPDRSFAFTTVIQFDMRGLRLATVAGTKQPGGPVGKPGPGVIPNDVVQSGNLVAAFDGGFQYRDGMYGMVVGETTYLPLKPDLGTLVGYTDGTLKIVNYTGQSLGNNVAFIRQNCPILIDNGSVAVLDEKNKALWGRTLSSSIVTWRSGIGLTANGNLLYAVGNNLTPQTLARGLQLAGAVSAIQLDINPNWVRFNFFRPDGPGTYTSTPLLRALKDGSSQYLHGYTKDFFYLVKA